MPATVPPFGWRVPEGADPPDGPQAFLELATDIAATTERSDRVIGRTVALTFNSAGAASWPHGQGVAPTAVALNYVSGPTLLAFTLTSAGANTINIQAWRPDTGVPWTGGGISGMHIIATYPAASVAPAAAPVALPESTWLKADIVDWLLANGVALDPSALAHLTKTELLALVADLLDTETE